MNTDELNNGEITEVNVGNQGSDGEKSTLENDQMELDNVEENHNHSDSQPVSNKYVNQCITIFSDAKLSEEIIDEAITNNDKAALSVELTDLNNYEKCYFKAHLEVLSIIQEKGLDISEHEDRRKRFIKFVKSLKSKIQAYQNEEEVKDPTEHLKFEKINIAPFNGKKDDWRRFKAAFTTYYHNSKKLLPLEKHQVLFSKTTGEAHDLIDEYPLDGQYYEEAWNTLLDHFDDPLKTVAKRIDTLFNCPAVGSTFGKPPRKQTLRNLITKFRPNATALQMTFKECPEIDPVSQFFIYAFLQKADRSTRLEWEREVQKASKFATFKEFLTFMDGRCNSYERAIGTSQNNSSNTSSAPAKVVAASINLSRKRKCFQCGEDHHLHRCPEFLKKTPENRMNFIRSKFLCPKCFRPQCKRTCQFKCKQCQGHHNSLVHLSQPRTFFQQNDKETQGKNVKLLNKNWVGSLISNNTHALLATVNVDVINSNLREKIDARALLDSGSQINFITSRLVNKINSQVVSNNYSIIAIGKMQTEYNKETEIIIQSKYSNFKLKIKCVIVDEILEVIPCEYFPIDCWNFPKYLSLADPSFNIPNKVDLLLGLKIFWKCMMPKFYDLNTGSPRLWATHFGWLVTGEVNLLECNANNSNYAFLLNKNDILAQTIERFWLLEDKTENKTWSFEEEECEQHFLKNTFRNKIGRFVVSLPFKMSKDKLGESKAQALKRFWALEKKFSKDLNYKKAYENCIEDYIHQGHLKLIQERVGEQFCMLPHHGVIKESSSSTPLRVVFDGSMKTNSGLSLNDCLMTGPVVQSDLTSIIMRSRIHKFVFSTDVKQMYRQILVNKEDTKFQRIFWRVNPFEPLLIYELTTVTFGISTAPYLATRCLNKLAEDLGDKYPLAKTPLLRDCYVDDIFTGANSVSDLIEIKTQLDNLLNQAGFQLNKWCSNNNEFLKKIPTEKLEKSFILSNDTEFEVKTLGIIWLPLEDIFRVKVNIKKTRYYTKREILSILSSIFDPNEYLAPVTIVAKLIMQSLWIKGEKKGLGWDSEIPESVKKQWNEFSQQLNVLNSISINRHIFKNGTPNLIELHGFSDASEKAYGAVVYIRYVSNNGVFCELFASKTRVAPLKKQTLPRLELCAFLELSKLVNKVQKNLNDVVKFNTIRLWTDSEIVLHWINSPAQRWQVFVGNRVQKIQDLSNNFKWDYIHTKANPADIISRGINPIDLEKCEMWWHGPKFLTNTLEPFGDAIKFNKSQNNLPEIRNSIRSYVGTIINSERSFLFNHFSNFIKLVRISAWCIRFNWNSYWNGPKLLGPLQHFEIQNSINTLIKLVQRECFSQEIKMLENNTLLRKESALISLSPFLDSQGLIRVGGRLQDSTLSFEARFPIVLPPKHPFTKLLIKYEHEMHLHAGPKLLGSVLRRKYWILKQNNAIKTCIHFCKKCILYKAQTQIQFMASLPKPRVVPAKPFHITGVDYAGPVNLLGKGGRHRVITQAYIVIFVCFSTKAIHLELASDLTSVTFLAAFDRFISRRGIPSEIFSDNGTTFKGADTKLKELRKFVKENGDNFSKRIIEKGCKWNFIPASSPHMGGLWEAGVKSIKSHLRPTLGSSIFTYEQYETTLTLIEACLNSRPLTLESSDPNEASALTPGHFLVGGPITALPNPDITSIPVNRLKYWELTKRKVQEFWNRWSKEYLNSLQQRGKWRIQKNEFKIDDVVIIKEDNQPPTEWLLGVITELHPGKDKLVRVVTLRTFSKNKISHIKRPVTKLIYLPK